MESVMDLHYKIEIMDKIVAEDTIYTYDAGKEKDWQNKITSAISMLRCQYGNWATIHLTIPSVH